MNEHVALCMDYPLHVEELIIEDTSMSSALHLHHECRICHEGEGEGEGEEKEEGEAEKLESPCSCSGSLKFAHRKCIQRWCNEKGDTTCEICAQPFKSGYTAPPLRSIPPQHTPIDFRGNWGSVGPHNHHHVVAMAECDEYATHADISGAAACFRSTAFLLMVLLLLRHALIISAQSTAEDIRTSLIIFFLRAAGFLLPCYMMARTMNVLQCMRRQQEEAMAAAEIAILLQTEQSQAGVNIAADSSPSAML